MLPQLRELEIDYGWVPPDQPQWEAILAGAAAAAGLTKLTLDACMIDAEPLAKFRPEYIDSDDDDFDK
jgi:hypothetical protein